MPGFDDALERLVVDPAFAAALAADPDRALAGFTLSPDEAALLRSQVSTGTGDTGHSTVEARTSQSSVFGLFGGGLPDLGAGTTGFGTAPAPGSGFGARTDLMPPVHGSGPGAHPDRAGLGAGAGQAGPGPGRAGFGAVPDQGLGDATAPAPDGYRTRVDADGDGSWDRHTVRGGPDGGAEILVDRDGDGRADFIGHDVDADGIVDHADYDVDRDGTPDERLTDTDGDGWLDTSTRR